MKALALLTALALAGCNSSSGGGTEVLPETVLRVDDCVVQSIADQMGMTISQATNPEEGLGAFFDLLADNLGVSEVIDWVDEPGWVVLVAVEPVN